MMFLTERPVFVNAKAFAQSTRKPFFGNETPTEGGFQPFVSIFEAADAYVIRAELPGVTVDSLEITLERDELTIKGEKLREVLADGATWLRDERGYGKFERTFRFTTPVANDGVVAEMHDGLLTIRVAKAKEALPRKITVVSK